MDLVHSRRYAGIVSIGKMIYVFGADHRQTAETYNGQSWQSLPDIPCSAYGFMWVAYNGKVIIYDETDSQFWHFYPESQ